MLNIFWVGMIFAIYNAIYFKRFAHRPKIYSQNVKVMQIYSKVIYPLYFLPSGALHTVYQLYRKISIIDGATRKSVVVDMPDDASLLLDIFEPSPSPRRPKRGKTVLMLWRTRLAVIFSVVSMLKIMGFIVLKALGVAVKMRGIKSRKAALSDSHSHAKHMLLDKETNDRKAGERSAALLDNVLLVHGLNGSSNSTYIKGMTNVFLKKNCRVFCFNARGSRLPPKTNKFSHIGLTSDIEGVVEYILENYSGDLTLVGFSMGANWVARFLGECKDKDRIKMGVGVCCPFDFLKLRSHYTDTLYGLYLNHWMANNYKRYIKRSMIDPVDLSSYKYLEDVDKFFLNSVFGSDNLEEFYQKSSCVGVLDSISKPFLFLSSSDDPLVPVGVVPVDICKKNSNISLIIIKGGHLGFFTNGRETMAEIIVGKYYSIISQTEDDLKCL